MMPGHGVGSRYGQVEGMQITQLAAHAGLIQDRWKETSNALSFTQQALRVQRELKRCGL